MISADDSIKTVGLLTLIVIGGKLIYNLIHFAYTTFIGRWLRHGIDPRKCGPWAGNNIRINYSRQSFIVIYRF